MGIFHSRPVDSKLKETTEIDCFSTLLEDVTLFSSHTVNSLSPIDPEKNNNENNNNEIIDVTTNNKNIYESHGTKQPVNSNVLTQISDPLNTTLPLLSNINTPLPRLQKPNSVHFNIEPIMLNTST